MKPKAILFDSGNTLCYPKTGNWFLPPKYYEIYKKYQINHNSIGFWINFAKARNYLDKNHLIKDESEEKEQFKEFYKMLLAKRKYQQIRDEAAEILSTDNVYNDEKFIFYDDVKPTIEKLSKDYTLGIVSDTWPSLERVYRNYGIYDYFQIFIMSSIYGSTKSNKELFIIALEKLNINPNEIAFVDDSYSNLRIADEIGLIPIKITRNDNNNRRRKSIKMKNHLCKEIKSIRELENIEW